MIDTAKVKDRRQLRYESIDDLLLDIERLIAAEKSGTLRTTGNWTAGQVLGHIATWIEYGYEGYPMRVPWFIRFFLRKKKAKYLRDGMVPGVRIPGTVDGTFGTALMTTEEGAARLRRAAQRLQDGEPAKFDSPAFGPMPHDERVAFNLRHAELHMSFLHP